MRKLFLSMVFGILSGAIAPVAFAQFLPTGMFGPQNPATVDTNGLFTADPTGICAIPLRSGANLTLIHPWSDIPATGTLCGFDPTTGKYTAICRTTPAGLTQMISIIGFSAFHAPGKVSASGLSARPTAIANYPSAFRFTESGAMNPKAGTGTLIDQNGDGIFDGITLAGSVSVTIPFVFVDTNGDGWGDYASIPWSDATLVGINPKGAVLYPSTTPNPQIWVPLADTNGDGKPDSVVLDLTGSGTPDPDLFSSPAVGPVLAPPTLASAVPTFSEWGVLGVLLSLAAVGLWQLKVHAA